MSIFLHKKATTIVCFETRLGAIKSIIRFAHFVIVIMFQGSQRTRRGFVVFADLQW
jgi:hypothetical protein